MTEFVASSVTCEGDSLGLGEPSPDPERQIFTNTYATVRVVKIFHLNFLTVSLNKSKSTE